MNKKRLMAFLAAGVLTFTSVNPVMVMAEEKTAGNQQEDAAGQAEESTDSVSADDQPTAIDDGEGGQVIMMDDDSGMVVSEDGFPLEKMVKATDLSMPSQDSYEYPYMGLKAVLPDELKKQMDDSNVLMISAEEWKEDASGIKYAYLHWDKLTEEQKSEEINMIGTGYEEWLASIERLGTLGMYSTDVLDNLDTITGCNEHKELGTSADGNFKYYLSVNKDADSELTAEIQNIDVTLTDMTEFNPNQSVFDQPAEDSNPDATTVGTFTTTDIDGNEYTESVFSGYDLTLVNAFTTWCSPCVNELPELEKLYQELKEQGVGVVGMVLDTVDNDGKTDEDVVAKAQKLKEKTGVTYPLLIPDEGNLNGRISGLQSFPESFFVDKDGNIVGEPIMGSNDLEGWKEIVEKQLEEIKAEK